MQDEITNRGLQPLDVERRRRESLKISQREKYEMGMKQVKKKQDNYNRSVEASGDDYMRNAMKKIRNDNRTLDDDFTRFNGSYLHAKSSR